MAYATLTEARSYIKLQAGQTTDDDLITRLLDVATAHIERVCHRTFAAAAATRVYSDLDRRRIVGQRLYLGAELVSVSAITNGDGQAISASSYWLEPANEPPYSIIHLKSGSYWLIDIDRRIEITAVWGYSASPPADVQEACLELTKYLYHLRETASYDVTAMPDLGQMIIPGGTPKSVRTLIAPYIRTGW